MKDFREFSEDRPSFQLFILYLLQDKNFVSIDFIIQNVISQTKTSMIVKNGRISEIGNLYYLQNLSTPPDF